MRDPFFLSAFNLGVRVHTGEHINDVALPPWAKTPEEFIHKHKEALVIKDSVQIYMYTCILEQCSILI